MTTHWILRIGDADNFKRSKSHNVWGIRSAIGPQSSFIEKARKGDILWFVVGGSGGKVFAVAKLHSINPRQLGELVNLTPADWEYGWEGEKGWTHDVHYTDAIDISNCNIQTHIKGNCSVRRYTKNMFEENKCAVDLEKEYPFIYRYYNAHSL